MMSRVTLAAAVAGCASVAGAQDFSLSLVPSATILDCSGGTFTVSVYGDASVGTHMLGGAFGFEVGDGAEYITGISWQNAAWSQFNTDGGYAGNGVHNQVVFGQLVIPGIFPPQPGSELGSLIGQFQLQYSHGSPVFMELNLIAGLPFSLESVDANTGQTFNDSNGNLTIHNAQILLCPAPGTVSGFACIGLLAARRKR